VTKRERMPRKVTVEGSRLDAPFVLGGDPGGNRAQRRAAAKGKRRTAADAPAKVDGSGT
jgi:hypothetical protein